MCVHVIYDMYTYIYVYIYIYIYMMYVYMYMYRERDVYDSAQVRKCTVDMGAALVHEERVRPGMSHGHLLQTKITNDLV